MNNKKATTLIELLVTVLLIAILLALGVVNFSKMTKIQNATTAAQQISMAINKAKSYSKKSGTLTEISLPVGYQSYSITADQEVLTDDSKYGASSGLLPDETIIISNSCGDLTFHPNGSILDSFGYEINYDCSIEVGYTGDATKTIDVKAGSGNVTWR